MGGSRAVRERRRLRRDLRGAVHALRSGTRRRLFTPVLHVGSLGGPEVTYDAGDALDLGLRAEIAAALVSRALAVVPGPELVISDATFAVNLFAAVEVLKPEKT